MKSKIHRATVTEADLDYVGSLTVDAELMKAVDLMPHEKVAVVNINNGARFETYCIEGEPGSGIMCVNGAAARHAHRGDLIIVIAYGQYDEQEARTHRPAVAFVDAQNHILPDESAVVEAGLRRSPVRG
jgi:aspartate 1-decarboxylase